MKTSKIEPNWREDLECSRDLPERDMQGFHELSHFESERMPLSDSSVLIGGYPWTSVSQGRGSSISNRYGGRVFTVTKNGEVVAEIRPAEESRLCTLREFAQVWSVAQEGASLDSLVHAIRIRRSALLSEFLVVTKR